MNSHQAKKIPIYEVLSRLGYEPVRKDKGGIEWVYNSPFRQETVPSLFVNIQKNVWNDFGDRGGDLLDFIMHHENTDFRGALEFLEGLYSKTDFKARKRVNINQSIETTTKAETLILDKVMPLKSAVLENYLKSRGIDTAIARQYLEVVNFHNSKTGTKYFGLGLKNMSSDYEVRNPKLKTVVGNKDISFIKGRGEATTSIAVFEGMSDFLSYLTDKKINRLKSDVVIMNSTKLVERTKQLITNNSYEKVYTFFDNDKSGEKAQDSFAELSVDVIPCNHVYQDYKDYCEYFESKKQTHLNL